MCVAGVRCAVPCAPHTPRAWGPAPCAQATYTATSIEDLVKSIEDIGIHNP
jgi:hypothetical protein